MFRDLLCREFSRFERLTPDQLDKLEDHFKLLNRWNKRLNLTRIQETEHAVRLHYCESLFLGHLLPPGVLAIVDVGSGAGFPGIPVAVLRPECSVELVESHQRKSVFLRQASRKLANVKVLAARAESVCLSYDWLIGRAVRPKELLSLHLAPNVAILMGTDDMDQMNPVNVLKIPWGENRVVAMFHVEH